MITLSSVIAVPTLPPPADPAQKLQTPVTLMLMLDRRTFNVLLQDAEEAGQTVEELTSQHLAKCAGT